MIIRKSNPIPVEPDGAEGIPPALGVARHGLGTIALPFTFHRPFHGGQYDG